MRCAILTLMGLSTTPEAMPAGDLAGEVRAVLAAKCAGCHGPTLARPKGRFGYVLDLGRVAGNREMVVPGAPDESELWELVRRDEMPPDDSPAGPLTPAQKETVRAWIAGGAPASTAHTLPPEVATTPAAESLPRCRGGPPIRGTRTTPRASSCPNRSAAPSRARRRRWAFADKWRSTWAG